jgi:hypothetical protein
MNKKEWQSHHGFDDQDMAFIELCLKEFEGTIVSIKNIPLDKDGKPVPFIERWW